MLHGTKNEGRELLNKLSMLQASQIFKNKIVTEAWGANNIQVLGKSLHYVLSPVESALLQNLNADLNDMHFYGRILMPGRKLFSSREYDRQFKRRNSFIRFEVGGERKYGQIIVFCKSENLFLCLVSVFLVRHHKFFVHKDSRTRVKHIVPVLDSTEIVACKVASITEKLIQIGEFLCARPNVIENNL